jgi:hypothetical protein
MLSDRSGGDRQTGEPLATMQRWKVQVQADTHTFMERCLLVHQFFPELNGIEWKAFPQAIAAARAKIGSDKHFVCSIYASFLDADAPKDAPPADIIDPNWAFFRWVQCQIAAALRIFERYQGRLPSLANTEFWTRAEHSMHDAYHIIHGSLAGAMATMDREVAADLILVRPDTRLTDKNGSLYANWEAEL